MDDSVDHISRVGVGGRVRCLEAAALIDRDIHDHRTLLHRLQHLPGDQFRCARAGDQNSADHDIGCENLLLDRLDRREARADPPPEQFVEFPQSRERSVQDADFRAETNGHPRSVRADDPAANHHNPGRYDARYTAEQKASAACAPLQGVARRFDGKPSCHLAHRGEQGQPSLRIRDRLIRNRGAA